MNKIKVMISVERQKVRQTAVRWPCGSAVKVLVAIHYSVLVARNGYIESGKVIHLQRLLEPGKYCRSH